MCFVLKKCGKEFHTAFFLCVKYLLLREFHFRHKYATNDQRQGQHICRPYPSCNNRILYGEIRYLEWIRKDNKIFNKIQEKEHVFSDMMTTKSSSADRVILPALVRAKWLYRQLHYILF